MLPITAKRQLGATNGEISVRTDRPVGQQNPHYLRVRAYEPGYGLYNTGYRGMGFESGVEYRFSAYVRTAGPKAVRATITDESGRELGNRGRLLLNRHFAH